MGSWIGPRSCLDAVENINISSSCRESNPGCPARSMSLYRLSYPGSCSTVSYSHCTYWRSSFIIEWSNDTVEILNQNTEKENVQEIRQVRFINYFRRRTMPTDKSAGCNIATYRKARKVMDSLFSSFRRERQKHEMKEFGLGTEEICKSTWSFLSWVHKGGNNAEHDRIRTFFAVKTSHRTAKKHSEKFGHSCSFAMVRIVHIHLCTNPSLIDLINIGPTETTLQIHKCYCRHWKSTVELLVCKEDKL
jgi:hypothetical protein